ncbi:NINE protein [Paenibacillus caui]|uniref:NINE protein n=1 Tax=Paenibacillus caui TaxID=2873927 RepID=UPI001CA7D1D2|nr:TM2 domain-containing protein [Paenibacillus caui]
MAILKQDLTTNELLVLNSELQSHEKSLAIAYLMLIGGHLGIHRFYLRRTGTAVAQLVLFLAATFFYIAFLVLTGLESYLLSMVFLVLLLGCAAVLTVWIIVDLFLIPGMVRSWNARAEQEIMERIVQYRSSPQASNPYM